MGINSQQMGCLVLLLSLVALVVCLVHFVYLVD